MTTRLFSSMADLQSWEPSRLLAPTAAEIWSGYVELVSLSDCTSTIPALTLPIGSRVTVSPGDVDPSDGTLKPHTDASGGLGYGMDTVDGLRSGDLLMTANRPTIRVLDAHAGLTFSSSFLALRPDPGLDSAWVWAITNTTAGRTYRLSSTNRTGLNMRGNLRASDLMIPRPAESWPSIRNQAIEMEYAISARSGSLDAGQSWTRRRVLPATGSWQRLLALPDPDLLESGTPLGELLNEVRIGRSKQRVEEDQDGWMGVVAVPQLRGAAVTHYADPNFELTAVPGDVLFQEIGTSGAASLVPSECIVGGGVIRLRLKDDSLAPMVVAFLNSSKGRRQRRALTSGTTIPRITRTTVCEFRVVNAFDEDSPTQNLSLMLDELLGS